MATAKANQSQKNYLRDRVAALFAEAFSALKVRGAAREADAVRTVFEKAGFNKIEDEARKIMRQIDDINLQYMRICGKDLVTYNINPITASTHRHYVGGLLQSQIDAELAKHPEGQEAESLRIYQRELNDKLYLSSDDVDLMTLLHEAEARVREIISPNKALTDGKKK